MCGCSVHIGQPHLHIYYYSFKQTLSIHQRTQYHCIFWWVDNENGKNISIFFSPYLTQAEKMKAYLIDGARQLRVESVYPNRTLGFGALCLENSLPG